MKICLIRNDKMGDMILTLPVVQGLKEANQDYTIDIVCSKKNQKICKNYKSINKIITIRNYTRVVASKTFYLWHIKCSVSIK